MITVVVPISPIISHPDTSILTETLDSVRHHLPDSEIILTFDGVRPENESLRKQYDEFTRRAIWLADHTYGHVFPLIFDEHLHQSGMMRAALNHIDTELLLYVEQDTPLVTDEFIDWQTIIHFLTTGISNTVRLHHESVIPDAHKHLIHGLDDGFWRTSQWSQRPHVSTKAYYRRIINDYFSCESRCFIEDRMHGVVAESYILDGLQGWRQHRLHIYNPGNGNLKRSYHLDGRAGQPKYDGDQVF